MGVIHLAGVRIIAYDRQGKKTYETEATRELITCCRCGSRDTLMTNYFQFQLSYFHFPHHLFAMHVAMTPGLRI
jgi:hypothetical protein